jgi:hypothetical protein
MQNGKNNKIKRSYRSTTTICIGMLMAVILSSATLPGYSQDSGLYIKVHFLYGSKPLKAFKKTEPRWFGGILGGHAGIEGTENQVLSFIPHGKFHLVARRSARHSRYIVDSLHAFYSRLGGQHPDSAKKVIIVIPVSVRQKRMFDSIAAVYLKATPYDYALIGMRCGAATYEILAQLGIVNPLPLVKNIVAVPYPKKLRRQLLKKAKENGWTIIRKKGSSKRKWETDYKHDTFI